jgi:hypothetical protein
MKMHMRLAAVKSLNVAFASTPINGTAHEVGRMQTRLVLVIFQSVLLAQAIRAATDAPDY